MEQNKIKQILEAIHHLTTTLVYDEFRELEIFTQDELDRYSEHLSETHVSVGHMINILEQLTNRPEGQE